MKLQHTTDMDAVYDVVSTPEIWQQASQDGMDVANYYPSFDGLSAWLLCTVNDEKIGVIYVHNESLCAISIHPYMKEKHKSKGRKMMLMFFKWFNSLPPELCKVNITIPSDRKIVYNFAKKLGFKDEGVSRDSVKRNGVVCDQYLLGLTRKEIKGLL